MEFSTSGHLGDMEDANMDAISSSVTMATVTISPHQFTDSIGGGAVPLEGEASDNQTMGLYLQTDGGTEFQQITSLAEQQGISIMPDLGPVLTVGGDNEQEGGAEFSTPHVIDAGGDCEPKKEDACSLLAKLRANNTPRSSYVQLTSDGKIIHQKQGEEVAGEGAGEGAAVVSPMQGLLQQVTLQDGSIAYMPHPASTGPHQMQLEDGSWVVPVITSKDPMQAVRMEDGSIAYVPADLLQQSATTAGAITATVNLNLESAPTHPQGSDDKQLDVEGSMEDSFVSPDQLHTTAKVESSGSGAGSEAGKTVREHLTNPSYTDHVYRCHVDDCGKVFSSNHHLKVHMRVHTGDRPYVCEHVACGKAFATGYGLKSHRRTHTGEKPYRCMVERCNKAFKTSGDLQKHTRTHTGERPFLCPFEGCNKSFTTSNIRKVHIRTHTGERPYMCPAEGCGKKFSSATNYKNHIRIHTGERPYVCTVTGCGKRFTEYSSLYKHHVVHTHTKPYICNHCGKTYRQTSTLATHKRQAHNDTTPIAEMEVSLVLQPPDPKTSYQPETELGEGALVINTADCQPAASASHSSAEVEDEASSEGQPQVSVSASSTAHSPSITVLENPANISILLPASGDGGGQPVFILTGDNQVLLQELAGQNIEIQLPGQGDVKKEDTSSAPGVS